MIHMIRFINSFDLIGCGGWPIGHKKISVLLNTISCRCTTLTFRENFGREEASCYSIFSAFKVYRKYKIKCESSAERVKCICMNPGGKAMRNLRRICVYHAPIVRFFGHHFVAARKLTSTLASLPQSPSSSYA